MDAKSEAKNLARPSWLCWNLFQTFLRTTYHLSSSQTNT